LLQKRGQLNSRFDVTAAGARLQAAPCPAIFAVRARASKGNGLALPTTNRHDRAPTTHSDPATIRGITNEPDSKLAFSAPTAAATASGANGAHLCTSVLLAPRPFIFLTRYLFSMSYHRTILFR
ncbi:hypothetical protein CPI22_09115, partial [Moraxella catarrhalis]|nr:hypothetical protein [Moraxella catarrhalis]